MNKKLLKKMQARNKKRLEEIRQLIKSGEVREDELDELEAEATGLAYEQQDIADQLAELEEYESDAAEEIDEEEDAETDGAAETGEGEEGNEASENRAGMISQEGRSRINDIVRRGMNARATQNKEKKEQQIRSAFANFIVGNIGEAEARSLGIEAGNGGVTVPDVIASEVITYAQEENVLRRLGHVVRTKGNVKYPFLIKKAEAQGHKKERGINEPIPETDIEFDEVYLEPTEFDALATVTKKLLKQSGVPIEDIVLEELKKAYVRKEIQYMFEGNETGNINPGALAKKAVEFKPAATVTVLYDQLVKMKNSLPKHIRKKARWILNTAAMDMIETMKTDDGFPLLKPLEQAQDGCEYKLLGYLVEEEDQASKTGAEDTAVFYFGDFYSFKIQDVTGSMEIQILKEKYSDNNRVGFKIYALEDAQLIYSPFEPTVYRFEVAPTAPAGD